MNDIRRLFGLARPHWHRLALATGILMLGTLLNLAVPTQVQVLLDSVFNEMDARALNRVALIIGGLLLLRMLTGVAANYLLQWTGERIVADLRRRLFAHLVSLDLGFFTHTRLGEITSRMTNDVVMIQTAVTSTLTNLVERTLLAAGACAIMFWYNWRLTLAVFVAMPLVVVLSRLFGRQVHRLSAAGQDRLAAANSVMEEALGAIRVVKIFVREPFERDRFEREVEGVFGMALARVRLAAFYSPTITLLFMGGLMLVIWLGGREVLAGRLTVGEMFAILMYASLITSSAQVFAAAYGTLKHATGASERVFELLDQPPHIVSPVDGGLRAPMRGAIRFDSVSFAYESGFPVLADLSFEIAPGEVVALVGVSGVGKSTLMDLLPRYYDVTGGRILIDGTDVRAWNLAALRRGIASVPQETVLFADTVRQNLLYGRLEATDAEIEAAARAANAHEFVRELPQGYETLVGERGVRLSGGQRQRIAIARALLKEPAILLLDEATSSLDSESERAVQRALDALLAARGRTTLVIAHRLSTVRNADRILVLAPVDGAGRLVEQGTHEELLRQRGVYHRLYTMQFQDEAGSPFAGDGLREMDYEMRDVVGGA